MAREHEPRVVIQVAGGVAEEVNELAQGPVHTFIVDFDDLDEMSKEDRLKYITENYPSDIAEWILRQL
jgi:hypothetical protein